MSAVLGCLSAIEHHHTPMTSCVTFSFKFMHIHFYLHLRRFSFRF